MLVKHSSVYLLARGLPGVVNFAALSLYTQLLTPIEYGRYALVVSGISLFHVVFFQWINLSLLRFLPRRLEHPKTLYATILAAFSAMVLATGAIGLVMTLIWPDPVWKKLIALALPLLWAQAWLGLNLELARSSLHPIRYGMMMGSKVAVALLFGVILVLWGIGEYGPLLGLLCAMVMTCLLWGRQPWCGLITRPSKKLFVQFIKYGFPLTATFALAFVISTSDRFLVAHFLGESMAGLYSASYDLASQPLMMLMVIVNLAAYPIAVRALEHHGLSAAQEQLRINASLLISIGLPVAVSFALLSSNIANVILGENFRKEAAVLLPWISISILFAGLRSFYFDIAYQLARKTIIQTFIVGVAAFSNFVLNIWLIPKNGVLGAAQATFISYAIALVLSMVLSHRAFDIPIPWLDLLKVGLATAIMGIALLPTLNFSGALALAVQALLGATIFVSLILISNVGGYRKAIIRSLAK